MAINARNTNNPATITTTSRTSVNNRPDIRDHRTPTTAQPRGNYVWKNDHWERVRAPTTGGVSVRPGTTRPPVLPPPVANYSSQSYASHVPNFNLGGSSDAALRDFTSKVGVDEAGVVATMPKGLRETYEKLKETDPVKAQGFIFQMIQENLKLLSDTMSNYSKSKHEVSMTFSRNLR